MREQNGRSHWKSNYNTNITESHVFPYSVSSAFLAPFVTSLDCELFFFFSDLVRGSERARERRAAKRRSDTRVVICVSRAFCSTDQENRETTRNLSRRRNQELITLKNLTFSHVKTRGCPVIVSIAILTALQDGLMCSRHGDFSPLCFHKLRIFTYSRYRRFHLFSLKAGCFGMGRRPTHIRSKAETTSSENRKPRMDSFHVMTNLSYLCSGGA